MAYYKYRIYHISNVAERRIIMTKFNDFLNEQLKDPEIKEEYYTFFIDILHTSSLREFTCNNPGTY